MRTSPSQALVPQILSHEFQGPLAEVLTTVLGIGLLAGLARVTVYLPWTPVPITGQSLGVALVALSWGRQRAFAVLVGYLALGTLGLPVFAAGKSGLTVGPTVGYLVGMVVASVVVGTLADRGFTKSYLKTVLAAFAGSAIIFTFGLAGLSFFVPREALLGSGLLPFLPGDVIKNLIAATVSWRMRAFKG
jgi:biotin transport system substrate-specific component